MLADYREPGPRERTGRGARRGAGAARTVAAHLLPEALDMLSRRGIPTS
jgi:hypothetical protein